MEKILILILILILVAAITIISSNIKKEQTLYTSSWTKAVCTQDNYCEDYEIICNGNKIVRMTPTGAAIQFSKDWKDPRDEEIRNRFC